MPAHGSDKIPEYGCIIGGEERFSGEILEVRFPYNGDLVARVHQATPGDLEDALVFARNGFEKTRALSSGDRYRILYRLAELVESRSGELAVMLSMKEERPSPLQGPRCSGRQKPCGYRPKRRSGLAERSLPLTGLPETRGGLPLPGECQSVWCLGSSPSTSPSTCPATSWGPQSRQAIPSY